MTDEHKIYEIVWDTLGYGKIGRPMVLTLATNLNDPELGLDSMDRAELIMLTEGEFKITISTERAAAITTLGQLLEAVQFLTGKT